MRSPILLAALLSLAHADRVHSRVRYTDAAIEQLRRTGECDKKTARWWCRAARWDDGTGALLPLDRPLIGRWLTKGQPGSKQRALQAVEARDELVACVVTGTREHPVIRIETLDDVDRDALGGVTRVLESKAPRVTLGAGLATRLRKLTGEFR